MPSHHKWMSIPSVHTYVSLSMCMFPSPLNVTLLTDGQMERTSICNEMSCCLILPYDVGTHIMGLEGLHH